jgi:hypothetical protein
MAQVADLDRVGLGSDTIFGTERLAIQLRNANNGVRLVFVIHDQRAIGCATLRAVFYLTTGRNESKFAELPF